MTLPKEHERFARHYVLPEVGETGQRKLRAAKVLVVGVGGLGSPVALYLVAAGIGTIGLVDFDQVELSNLQRQILFVEADVGEPKTRAGARRLRALNPEVRVLEHEARFTAANGLSLVEDYDLVIDGTDNFAARYLVNDACVLAQKPLIYGSVSGFTGLISAVQPGSSACYRCFYPDPPPRELVPNCAEGGVLGVVPGSIALLQATEALKYFLGIGAPLFGRVLIYDALSLRTREIELTREPGCVACSANSPLRSSRKLEESRQADAVAAPLREITSNEVRAGLAQGDRRSFLLIDVRDSGELAAGVIPEALSIPLGELPFRIPELDKNKELVVFCRSGPRSKSAALLLKERGFLRVRVLRGGFLAYKLMDSAEEKK